MTTAISRSIERILAPTDLGAPSQVAVLYAARLARDLAASITIVHVLTPPNQMVGIVPGASVDEELDTARANATDLMAALEADVRALGLARIVTHVDAAASTTARAILVRAALDQSDLIVMATRGRSGLPRAVFGSVADAIVRTASCPVLTLRPD